MIRESLNADSAHLMSLAFGDNAPRNNNLGAYEMQFRPAAGAHCQGMYPAVRPPAPPEFPAAFPNSWLRVARWGNQFSAFASIDGKTWKRHGGQVLKLASTVKVGLALTSHNPEVVAQAAFRDYTESNSARQLTMKRVQLATNGREFSRMVYGTWRLLDTKPTAQKINRRLRTDHVELFLVHRPDWLTRADDTAAGLNKLLRTGKIRAAGVSNYSASQFDLLNARMEQPLVTNQIEFHLLHPEPINDGTLHQCEKLGVLPMAWSPLAGGRLFDPSNPAAARLAAAATSMAFRYHAATLDQLAYAWILAHPPSSATSHRHEQTRTPPIRSSGRGHRAGT